MMNNARSPETLKTITVFVNLQESFPCCSVSINTPVFVPTFTEIFFGHDPAGGDGMLL